jgi:hypothetical protein
VAKKERESKMKDDHTGFMGTYFNKETTLKIARAAKVVAWIVLAIYILQFILAFGLLFSQLFRGFWVGMIFTDILQNFLSVFEQVIPGGLYFFILMAISHLITIMLDVEDNTRRTARQ